MKLNFDAETEYSDYFKTLNDINAAIVGYFKLPENLELELVFAGIKEMQVLNSEKRNINKPTDVLSFPYLNLDGKEIIVSDHKEDINPESDNLMLGEIVICTDIAKQQAEEFNHSLKRELCYLYVHGLLHLLGFDHIAGVDKSIMRTHEENILEIVNIIR